MIPKLESMIAICESYLEILEESGLEPLERGDDHSGRQPKWNPEVAFWKNRLLNQEDEKPPKGMPTPTKNEMDKACEAEVKGKLSNGDAVQLAVILAERCLKPLQKGKRRETLYRMRCELASQYFEHLKNWREDGHPADRILKAKPRYKTPCLMLVRHPSNEHMEVVTVAAQTAITYWGNPEAEPENHEIVRYEGRTCSWTAELPKALKSRNAKRSLLLLALGLGSQIAIFGTMLATRGCHTNTAQNQEVTTKPTEPVAPGASRTDGTPSTPRIEGNPGADLRTGVEW